MEPAERTSSLACDSCDAAGFSPAAIQAFVERGVADLRASLPPALRRRIAGLGVGMPFELWSWGEANGAPAGEMEEWRHLDIPAELEALCADTGFSRYPVLEDGACVGYVHVKDAIRLPAEVRDRPMPDMLVRVPSRIRSDEKLQNVMRTMQKDQTHFALVEQADVLGPVEPGKVGADGAADLTKATMADDVHHYAGIIAFEDVLEELVGEVREATAK